MGRDIGATRLSDRIVVLTDRDVGTTRSRVRSTRIVRVQRFSQGYLATMILSRNEDESSLNISSCSKTPISNLILIVGTRSIIAASSQPTLHYAGGCSDMDLGNKEQPRVESRSG